MGGAGGATETPSPQPTSESATAAPSKALQRLWRPRSLCFTLPLQPGDQLAVLGDGSDIANSARKAGASTVSVLTEQQAARAQPTTGEAVVAEGDTIPLPDASCDHAIVPRLAGRLDRLVPGELARIVRPGGTVFVGVPWRVRAPRHPSALSLRAGRRLLERAGFEDVRAYGVGPSLNQPRHLVPVDSRRALRWYLDGAYLPASRTGALASRVLRWTPGRAKRLLFPALGFVATRGADRGTHDGAHDGADRGADSGAHDGADRADSGAHGDAPA